MATWGKAPVKVGSGYIEIYPRLNMAALAKMRADLARSLAQVGSTAGRTLSTQVGRGFDDLSRHAGRASRLAGRAVEAEMAGTSDRLRNIERSLTIAHGEEAGKRLHTIKDLSRQRELSAEGASSRLRLAERSLTAAVGTEAVKRFHITRDAYRQREGSARVSVDRIKQLEKELTSTHNAESGKRLRTVREATAQREALEEGVSQAVRRRHRLEVEGDREVTSEVVRGRGERAVATRRLSSEEAKARSAEAKAVKQQEQLDRAHHNLKMNQLRAELAGLQQHRAEITRTIDLNNQRIKQFETVHNSALKSAAQGWKRLGQAAETFGTNVEQVGRSMSRGITFPALAAGGMLAKAGIQAADTQFYASEGLSRAGYDPKQVAAGLKSIQDFAVKTPFSLEEMTSKFSQVSRNFESYGYSTSESLQKSEQLIRSTSDFAAAYGVFDPHQVKRAMSAAETMLDYGKLNLRHLKMFSHGTGVPIAEMAKMAGYKDEQAFMAAVSKPGKGIRSKDFFEKFTAAHETTPGVKGSSERLGTASIGGAFRAMKEEAQLSLGRLFGDFDQAGKFQWTELGQRFHEITNKFRAMINDPGVQKLAKGLINQFAEAIEKAIEWVKKLADFLENHPGWREWLGKIAKAAFYMGPLLTAIGFVTRIFGKLGRAASPVVTAVGGVLKGIRGAFRVMTQVGAGVRSMARGGRYLQGYRQRRTMVRGGDTRGPIRRTWDRIRGKDSRVEKLKLNTKHAQTALKQVDKKIHQVRKSIRELDKQRLEKLVDKFEKLARKLGGEGGGSVKSEAKDAGQQIEKLKTAIKDLGDDNLNKIADEFGGETGTSIKAQAKDANQQIDLLKKDLKELNDHYKLDTIANEFGGEGGSSIKAQAKDANQQIDLLKKDLKELNTSYKLDTVANEFGGEGGSSIKAQSRDANQQIDLLKTSIKDLNAGYKLDLLAQEFGGEGGSSVKAQARDANQQIDQLKTALTELNTAYKLDLLAQEFGGEGGTSIKAQAVDANTQVDQLKTSISTLNQEKLNLLADEFGGEAGTSIKAQATDADMQVDLLRQSITALNQLKLNTLADEFGGESGTSVKAQARDADQQVDAVKRSVKQLNTSSLGGIRAQFAQLKSAADTAKAAIAAAVRETQGLNRVSLGSLKQQFTGSLSPAVKACKQSAQELKSQLDQVNGTGMGSVTSSVNGLTTALSNAEAKAASLRDRVNEVNSATAGGGGFGGSRKSGGGFNPFGGSKKSGGKGGNPFKARGGVLPGYQPNVDSIPAILSPGEAVLRPEVTRALGEPLINYWNEMAFRGRIRKHARGGSGGGGRMWPLNILDEIREILDVVPGVKAFRSGMDMMYAAQDLGGTIGGNIRGWASRAGGDAAGRLVNDRFGKVLSFVTDRLPEFLTRAPSGVGQIIGLAAGAIAPTAGQRFWEDVWKGEGNIVQRGVRFAANMVKSIPEIIENLIGNIWEVGKSLLKLAWEFAKDPAGFIKNKVMGAVQQLKDTFTGMINQITEMVRMLKAIWEDPSGAAKEMLEIVVERVKELMPNTKGLFDFAKGGIVPGYAPGHDTVMARLSPGEAVLRPEAVQRLGRRVVRSLNDSRGREPDAAKSGSGKAEEVADIPVPDAKAYEEAVKKVRKALKEMGSEYESTVDLSKSALDDLSNTNEATVTKSKDGLEDLTKALQDHASSTQAVEAEIVKAVSTAVDSGILPAQQKWIQHLQGPLSQTERGFQSTNRTVWTGVGSQVATSVSGVGSSFARMRADLDNLRRMFETSAARIQQVWSSAMSHVASAARSTINGPYNRGVVPMMAGMAKLAGTAAPLHSVGGFARGGIVPGYQPGVDSVPAMLSKGEGILRPEVVRALGAETIERWNEQARRTGHLYARGGVVGPLGWSGQSGGDWVNRNKDKEFENYMKAFQAGWKAVIQPMLNRVEQAFGVLGVIQKLSFQKVQPWLEKWVKWVDDHVFSGGGEVVKRAFQEYKAHGGSHIGTKYSGGVVEAWCADFISWCVDKAGANAAYGNSPRGTPGNRWAAVVTWVESMKNHVPTSQSRPGDLMVYGGRHSSGWDHINLKVSKTSTIGGNEGNSVRHSSSYWQRATKALRPSGGVSRPGEVVLNPWPGSVPKYDGPLGGGVDRGVSSNWTGAIAEAMRLTGVSGDEWMRGMAVIIQRESSGNPRDINLDDANARRGDPSRGLAQVIGETFREHHQPGTSWDIYDPVANLSASINYIRRRYGHISRVQQANPNLPPKGYASGVSYASPGMALVGEKGPELVRFRGGERVYSARKTGDMLGKRYEIHIHEAKSEDTTQSVIRGLKYIETMYGSF